MAGVGGGRRHWEVRNASGATSVAGNDQRIGAKDDVVVTVEKFHQ